LAASFLGYVIAYGRHEIYMTQALFEERAPALGEPFGMQLQNNSSPGIKRANYRDILGAVLNVNDVASLPLQILRYLMAKILIQPLRRRRRRPDREKFGILPFSLRHEPVKPRHRKKSKVDVLVAKVSWEISMPVCCSVYDNITRLGQRRRGTMSASPNGSLIWRKNDIDGLIDKGDFHTAALEHRAGAISS